MATQDYDRSLDALIAKAGWFKGTDRQWRAIPLSEREDIAFAATGCEVAYATWAAPVDCLHPHCQVRRGEKPPTYITECVLAGERSNYLRWLSDEQFAQVKAAFMAEAERTGIYDPWKMPGGWSSIVLCAFV